MDKSSKAKDSLENTLELAIENLRQIYVMVQDFQPQTQSVVNQKIKSIVTDLQSLDKLKHCVDDVQIPMEVIDIVDSGRNPQLFNKEKFVEAAAKNAEVKGKIDNYNRFQACLMHQLHEFFPNEMATYRTIRNVQNDENGDGKKDETDDNDDDSGDDGEEDDNEKEEIYNEKEEIDVREETPAVVPDEK